MSKFLSIIIFFGAVGSYFLGSKQSKHQKILTGVASFFILLGGMGLMARTGIEHGSLWPTWLLIKAFIWLLLAALAPILAKRMGPSFKVFYLFVCLAGIAAYMAINQPF